MLDLRCVQLGWNYRTTLTGESGSEYSTVDRTWEEFPRKKSHGNIKNVNDKL